MDEFDELDNEVPLYQRVIYKTGRGGKGGREKKQTAASFYSSGNILPCVIIKMEKQKIFINCDT